MARLDKKRREATPKTAAQPEGRSVPRAIQALVSEQGRKYPRPVFCFSKVDKTFDGEWGWRLLRPEHDLLGKIVEWSDNLWTEIFTGTKFVHRRHHGQPVSSLVQAAQTRLAELKWDESTIFRFGFDTMGRLWGFEFDGVFFVVWWDPDHKVYQGD